MSHDVTPFTPVVQFVFRKIEKSAPGDDEIYKQKLLETGCVTIVDTATGWTATRNNAPWLQRNTNDRF